jgi:hypothetical protein
MQHQQFAASAYQHPTPQQEPQDQSVYMTPLGSDDEAEKIPEKRPKD